MATAKKSATKATSKKAVKRTARKALAKVAESFGAKRGPGRPPKGASARSVGMTIRIEPEERDELHERAAKAGLSLADFVLSALRAYRP